MEDLKGMARAKRASSKRGRARHSHHKHAHADGGGSAAAGAGAAGNRAAPEEVLPSNWERYSDDGGSEDERGGIPVDGEVRPKSKGADYSQLLSSDGPKLYEDLPEPEGMFSMLLEPGGGMWNVDSWLEPPSTSEQQTAHDAAALLFLDLGLLGKSLARLHVAERLMVEKELFPKQETVKQEVAASSDSAKSSYRTDDRVKEHKADDFAIQSSAEIQSHEITASSLPNNGGVYRTDHPDAARSPVWSSPIKTPGNISGLKGQATARRNDVLGHPNRVDDRTTFETSAGPPGFRGFVPAAAEADLDELLDMLDSQASQAPLVSSNLRGGAELPLSPSLSFLSNESRGDPPFSKTDSLPRELNRTPAYGSGNHHIASAVASTDRSEQSKASSKESNFSAPSLDDDFDSWLDSI